MTFGRPARITKAMVVKAAYPSPNGRSADISTATDQTKDRPAKLDFFIAFCKLHHILGDVLETFYDADDDSDIDNSSGFGNLFATKTLDQLFKFDHDLSVWREGLPIHLQTPTTHVDASETKHITRQANTLHARYNLIATIVICPQIANYVQLLLHAASPVQTFLDSSTTNLSGYGSRQFIVTISNCQYCSR